MDLPFIRKTEIAQNDAIVPLQALSFTENGIEFSRSAQPQHEVDFYWQSLEQDGYADVIEGQYVLPWEDFFSLQKEEEHQSSLANLGLPPNIDYTPIIGSHGALRDLDFQINLKGWRDSAEIKQNANIQRTGAILTIDGKPYLLSRGVWELVAKVKEFARLSDDKTTKDNEGYFAKIRRLALRANAQVDDFLYKTIILKPENLQINMRRNSLIQDPLIEIQPSFDEAPDGWLQTFDKFDQVQDRYSITLPDGGIAYVHVTPEVKDVLHEIKKMPRRRVTGKRAESFLHNPFAQLGDSAKKVITPESFEQAKVDAEIFQYDLAIQISYDDINIFSHAELSLIEQSERNSAPISLPLNNVDQALNFVDLYHNNKDSHTNTMYWAGYEIALSPATRAAILPLEATLEAYTKSVNQDHINRVLNIENYSDRVVGIGAALKIHSEFMQRNSGETSWVPESILNAILPAQDQLTQELLTDINSQIALAENSGIADVKLPHLDQTISVEEAKSIAYLVEKRLVNADTPVTKPDIKNDKEKPERSVLIIHQNIEVNDYSAKRAALLEFNKEKHLPCLLSSLNPEVILKEHQKEGVAWLQHLHSFAPSQIRGCVLADDMGLGKTLQLLTFIGSYLESTSPRLPVLIIAPVSLLENWEAEGRRFFNHKYPKMLKLYGANLRDRKIPKHQLPSELVEMGISNLLCEGWRDDHKIVLTTYETLRDLEFSLAREHWSIMICDEAQKIKVPNALVTQAAKALKADFKIACTGTPVENSLTDLWCLFDLVQEGLLGSLNQFGKKYRRPIELDNEDDTALEELRLLIKPQILRRTKLEVAKDLPPKTEIDTCKKLTISALQNRLYDRTVQDCRQVADDKKGQAILGALQKMRMICAHPLVFEPLAAHRESPKVDWLISTLKEIQARQEKVIIFTEFRDIQSFLQRVIMQVFGIQVTTVNGDTSTSSEKGNERSRQGLIDAFQRKNDFNIIILSTTAVGFGVNMQKANHVIHYTRCWNPAKEDQATDRAYRIGQEKEVFVYYPTIYSTEFETFEVKLDRLLGTKRQLAGDMLNGSGAISSDELRSAVFG